MPGRPKMHIRIGRKRVKVTLLASTGRRLNKGIRTIPNRSHGKDIMPARTKSCSKSRRNSLLENCNGQTVAVRRS